MASRGNRVIACAQFLRPGTQYPAGYTFSKTDYPSAEYCFVGLVSLEDPPKHGVREAIGKLRLAGIKVMMVTGDHPKTAEAIARKINLILGDTKDSLAKKTGRAVNEVYEDEVKAVVVHGDDIDKLQGWEWDNSEDFYFFFFPLKLTNDFCARSLQQGGDCFRSHVASAQTRNRCVAS